MAHNRKARLTPPRSLSSPQFSSPLLLGYFRDKGTIKRCGNGNESRCDDNPGYSLRDVCLRREGEGGGGGGRERTVIINAQSHGN